MSELPKLNSLTSMANHQQVICNGKGGYEQLQVVSSHTSAQLAPQSVQVRVEFAGVAFADTMARRGLYPNLPQTPFVPGYDFCGTIEALGIEVTGLAVGQRVVGFMEHFGSYTQRLVIPAEWLVPVPEKVSSEAAASLVLNYLTAYVMLVETAHVAPNDTIFVNSAAGGVGTAVLDLARKLKVRAIGSASSKKLDVVRQYGARAVDRASDVGAALRKEAPRGVKAFIEQVADVKAPSGYGHVQRGGTYIINGLLSARGTSWAPHTFFFAGFFARKLIPDGRKLAFNSITKFLASNPSWFRSTMGQLLAWAAAGELSPRVGATIPLAEAARAHRLLEEGGTVGKIVLDCR